MEQGVIYGKITLKDGTVYEGQIRWKNEEALWNDIFDSPKHERPVQNLLTKAEAIRTEKRSEEFKFGFMALWEDKSPNYNFPFRCYFGNIVQLKSTAANVVLLTLKGGQVIKLKKGRAGDLNDFIQIYDCDYGLLEFDFSKIQTIDFLPTPMDFSSYMGLPTYGKILTTMGVFEGFITWDLEECLGRDLISGRKNGNLYNIAFEDIASIKAQNEGSLITLKSGQTLFLNDHDDVSGRNKGIVIRGLSFGQVKVVWKNFISATFTDPPKPRQYHEFLAPKLLQGSVANKNGQMYSGQLVFDLDEIYNLEFLNGVNNDFDYYIPFEKIARIEPQNDKYSLIYLKDGNQYLLGEMPDVTAKNHGLVLKQPENKADYIEWTSVKYIDFEQ